MMTMKQNKAGKTMEYTQYSKFSIVHGFFMYYYREATEAKAIE